MMKDQKLSVTRFLYLSFLSFFGTGFSPKAPGTVGSFATIGLILILAHFNISLTFLLVSTTLLTIFSCFIAEYAQNKEQVHDPGWIVMDEVIGMLFTWAFVFPSTHPLTIALVFIIFRFFDIIKVFPANWCDQKIKNGAGTIIDDVISAVYAGMVLLGINYFYPLP